MNARDLILKLFALSLLVLLVSCQKDELSVPPVDQEEPMEEPLYFPPSDGSSWRTTSFDQTGWNESPLDSLYSYLETNGTRAFIVLQKGKIVIEKYWGLNILGSAEFDQGSQWYWASAGKTLTSFLVGIAQEQGHLKIDEPSSKYLGDGWSSMDDSLESKITIWHHLTMTTGLDYNVPNLDCTESSCLLYKAVPGTQWFYHNAPYTLLESVVSNATQLDYNTFCDNVLEGKIGMSGSWIQLDYNNVYWSTARDAARFGLLILNKGVWDGNEVMKDRSYFDAMVSPSQELNPSYGYLWWLNGQESIVFPGLPVAINTELAPNAPDDLIVAAGKNGQYVDIVPSQNVVVVRMGEAPDGSLVPIQFHDEMWGILGEIIR